MKYEDIYKSFLETDCGCFSIGSGRYEKDKQIVFDNDEKGNARFGWVILRYQKECI